MKIIETTDSKVGKMSECVEDILLAGGRLMQCLEELDCEGYGERNTYGMRGGGRMGYREDDWGAEPPVISRYGERRMRNRYGRFV